MEQDRRDRVGRWAAPVALLALVTVAAVLIHDGLSGSGSSTTTPPAPATQPVVATTATRPRATRTGQTTTAQSAAQYYVVQSGDTYGSIAARYGTTVAQLEALNPGVSSTALTVGQRIRVK